MPLCKLPLRSLLVVALAVLTVLPALAQTAQPPQQATTHNKINYKSVNKPTFGAPVGGLNLETLEDPNPFGAMASPTTVEVNNLQGCGAVGQLDYTSALFNMPEVFGKFQADANSVLAKQILTMNYSMPQTAALFDTLNTYGNQRYDQFQKGCNLDDLKKDARQQFINACVTEDAINKRKSIIKKGLTGSSAPKDPLLSAMAYAQAYEICSMQYVSNTTAMQAFKDTNQQFADALYASQNVNAAVAKLICHPSEGGSADEGGCWANLLLPQVQLCLSENPEECAKSENYGIKPAPVNTRQFFDLTYTIFNSGVVTNVVNNMDIQFLKRSIQRPTYIAAGKSAALAMQTTSVSATDFAGKADLQAFQAGYLNCNNADPLYGFKKYVDAVKSIGTNSLPDGRKGDETYLTLRAFDDASFYEDMKVPETAQADLANMKPFLQAAMACTINTSVPVFDPNITTTLRTTCGTADRVAFYDVAGYDIAMNTTRELYKYLALQLKQAYGRLLTENVVPAAAEDGESKPATFSAAINAKLAAAIKDIMLPSVEAQLQRLNDLNNTRGAFGQKVQQIYSTKTGCVYSR